MPYIRVIDFDGNERILRVPDGKGPEEFIEEILKETGLDASGTCTLTTLNGLLAQKAARTHAH